MACTSKSSYGVDLSGENYAGSYASVKSVKVGGKKYMRRKTSTRKKYHRKKSHTKKNRRRKRKSRRSRRKYQKGGG